MKIAEAMLELNRIREHIEYLEEKFPLGFDIKKVDSDLGDKFIKDTLILIDNAHKKYNRVKGQVVHALVTEKFDKDNSLMDALINLESFKARRIIFDNAMLKFIEIEDPERIKKAMEQFETTITIVNKMEKALINKLNTFEVPR